MRSRRSFLSRLGFGASALGAALGFDERSARAQSPSAGAFQPTRHAQDDWLDQLQGKHRCFFDTATAEELSDAIQFCNNYMTANKSGYGLEPSDLAMVIGVRHQSAPFAFTDAIWAKHGVVLSKRAKFVDPKTTQPAMTNLRQTQLNNLAKRGVVISICDLSSHAIAGLIADSIGGKLEEIYTQMAANRMDNSRFVPAGIVAVNRAQEHGYSTM
jgi:intracellular sulfur oxidation DsrE/DsrF family protein